MRAAVARETLLRFERRLREWRLSGVRQIAQINRGLRMGSSASLRKRWSTTGLAPRPGSAERDLSSVPSLDLWPQPQAWSAAAQVEDRTRHVGVPVHILAHRVPMREPEDAGNVMRVDQIVDDHSPGHDTSLHLAADVAYGCELSVRRVM